MLHKTPKGQVL